MIAIIKDVKVPTAIYHVILLIFITIFYQQVVVINVGGSFKLYEFLGLILVVLFLLSDNKIIHSKHSLCLFIAFVLAPIPGNFINLLNPIKLSYYETFPAAATKLRFNIWIAPILIYLYYLLNWTVINSIIGSKLVFQNHKKVIRVFIISGSLVSFYSLYGYFFVPRGFPDLVPSFLDFRNSTPLNSHRPAGFSAEPGSYILILMWQFLYLLYIPHLFKEKIIQRGLLIITIVLLLLTQSSSLIAVFGAVVIYYFFLNGWSSRLYLIITLLCLLVIVTYLIHYFELESLVTYVFYEKVANFFSKSDYSNFTDSGQIRSYTNYLGIQIFKDHPFFGVGGGNSYFYLWAYEQGQPTGIITYDMLPQSTHGKILAELGLLGYIPFFLFFTLTIWHLFKKLKRRSLDLLTVNKYSRAVYRAGFIGTVATFGMLISIAPEYNLFIWVNIALILNWYTHENRQYEI
jgi:hypothetical protein